MLVPSGFEPFICNSQLDTPILLEQVQRDPSDHSHIFCRMAGSNPAFVFTKGHIQDPVQLIFNAPVAAHRFGQAFRIRGQTTNVVAAFDAVFFADRARRFNDPHTPQPFPLDLTQRPGERFGHPVPARFLPAVPVLLSLIEPHTVSLNVSKILMHFREQAALIRFTPPGYPVST